MGTEMKVIASCVDVYVYIVWDIVEHIWHHMELVTKNRWRNTSLVRVARLLCGKRSWKNGLGLENGEIAIGF